MRERRRLRLAERQLMLARVARREAMASLAGTIEEEARSADLARRSKAMARDYSGRKVVGEAGDLRELSAMAAAIARLAEQAENKRDDARLQAAWQADALAGVENRVRRLEDRALEARRASIQAAEARSRPTDGGLARKLQGHERHQTRNPR
ncbi:hypothetical protein [Erythrobacter sp. JK5]|uniref:hypothetical protein n=1 Tax=Erythrobacter sp. JK5 TaxID=2829500 RepID=UPI001BAC8C29|nr:hypothetical protein [Erythrobacter sp. JK5]QUL36912.1 hypothetical protein KDC96_10900 [Erythrobacter sp. JK5]